LYSSFSSIQFNSIQFNSSVLQKREENENRDCEFYSLYPIHSFSDSPFLSKFLPKRFSGPKMLKWPIYTVWIESKIGFWLDRKNILADEIDGNGGRRKSGRYWWANKNGENLDHKLGIWA
jgi:hypothetical protein